ncbi:hypothetical protein [Halobacillus campisalis]|uniref:Uncharacterized protein n=1 Tax=Halobacillus campisalis TaxID=435909 RepID=A0ABW2K749_9BACI|nr:hypothetical protein [Halobacillus campisalis]
MKAAVIQYEIASENERKLNVAKVFIHQISNHATKKVSPFTLKFAEDILELSEETAAKTDEN